MVQEVVINRCYGGFGLSEEAIKWMRERYPGIEEITTLPGEKFPNSDEVSKYAYVKEWELPRDHDALVEVVKELGSDAYDDVAKLKVVEVPDEVDWKIDEHDGMERITEKNTFSYP